MEKDVLEKNEQRLKNCLCVVITKNPYDSPSGGIYFKELIDSENSEVFLKSADVIKSYRREQVERIFPINDFKTLIEELKRLQGIKEEESYLTYNNVDVNEIISICEKYEINK